MTTPYGPLELVEEIRSYLTDAPALAGENGLVIADLDHAPNVDPPMAVVGPPEWKYASPTGDGVATYTLTVYVVVAQAESAFRELMTWTGRVARVLDEPPGTAVKGARPTVFSAGGTDLPAYAIDIEVTA